MRKHKKKSVMGKEGGWDFEVGQDLAPIPLNNIGLFESNQNVTEHLYYQLNFFIIVNQKNVYILFHC